EGVFATPEHDGEAAGGGRVAVDLKIDAGGGFVVVEQAGVGEAVHDLAGGEENGQGGAVVVEEHEAVGAERVEASGLGIVEKVDLLDAGGEVVEEAAGDEVGAVEGGVVAGAEVAAGAAFGAEAAGGDDGAVPAEFGGPKGLAGGVAVAEGLDGGEGAGEAALLGGIGPDV